MSTFAMGAVWKYARAKGSNLLVLVYIAECAQMDGRDAFPGVRAIAAAARMSNRGVRYVLHRLEEAGEIVIHHNRDRKRTWTTGKGHVFCPVWFIDVRCACDQAAYLAEGGFEACASASFPDGRPQKGAAKFAGMGAAKFAAGVRQGADDNGNGDGAKQEHKRTCSTNKDPSSDPSIDPSVDQPPYPLSGGRRLRILREDRQEAKRLLKAVGRCTHQPPHESTADCRAEIAAALAERRRDAEDRATRTG